MENKYILSEEFFGGIIRECVTKKNMYLDQDAMHVLKYLEGKGDIDFFNSEKDELIDKIELIKVLFEIGMLSTNYTFHAGSYKNHLSHPFRVFYDITYKCNLRCKHCFTESGEPGNKELNLEQKKEFIEQCIKLRVGRISIAGGEPFLCEDIWSFLKECKKNNLEVSVTTNGTHFTEEMIKELNEYNIKTLTVSLDAGTEDTMAMIRGVGVFDKVLAGLELLQRNYKHNYCVKMTLMQPNIYEVEDVIKIAEKYNCSSVKFNSIRVDGRARENSDTLVLTRQNYIEVVKRIEKLKEKYRISIKSPLNPYSNENYEYISELGFGCFAGKESMCVDPMGNVRPCSHFPEEFICGNIKEITLSEIWHTSPVLEMFRTNKGNEKCTNCTQYDKCRAGCRYRSYLAGNICEVDPFCYMGVE